MRGKRHTKRRIAAKDLAVPSAQTLVALTLAPVALHLETLRARPLGAAVAHHPTTLTLFAIPSVLGLVLGKELAGPHVLLEGLEARRLARSGRRRRRGDHGQEREPSDCSRSTGSREIHLHVRAGRALAPGEQFVLAFDLVEEAFEALAAVFAEDALRVAAGDAQQQARRARALEADVESV